MRGSSILVVVSVVFPGLVGCSSPSNTGGCPWTHASAVTVDPPTSCLAVSVANADGSGPGGCVDPNLQIDNHCAEPLVLQDETGAEKTIEFGGSAVVPVGGKGATTYSVPVTLGAQSLTLSFSTTH